VEETHPQSLDQQVSNESVKPTKEAEEKREKLKGNLQTRDNTKGSLCTRWLARIPILHIQEYTAATPLIPTHHRSIIISHLTKEASRDRLGQLLLSVQSEEGPHLQDTMDTMRRSRLEIDEYITNSYFNTWNDELDSRDRVE
jgi:hypothetical protein